MGAMYDATTFEASDIQTLKKNFSNYQSNSCYEKGNDSYAGHIGIANGLAVTDKTFATIEEAEDYVFNRAVKWGSAIAVKVGNFGKSFPSTQAEKKDLAKMQELENKVLNWKEFLIKRAKEAKSSTRSCKKCQSKISVKYISTYNCPVCHDHDFIETETDKKNFKRLTENLRVQKTKVNKHKEKYKNVKAYWYVGARCAN